MGGAGLGFGVLGPLLMSVDGTPVEPGARKQRAVLAMFVLNRNRPVAIESLIDAVWDQRPVPAARVTVQSYVLESAPAAQRCGVRRPRGASQGTARVSTQCR
jgi:SARP family transcriptional regulator, regulator of embCAB operon